MQQWLYLLLMLLFVILKQEPSLAQNLSWKNYTTDHGLPGNEVYDQLQDSRGYMWFATNHGICRFNGYEFIQPVDTSHLKGTEAFLPTEDNEGNIWFSRLDGSIWRIENDTISAWKYNAKIARFAERYRPIVKMQFAENGDLWLALHIHGFLVVNSKGEIREINQNNGDYFIEANVKSQNLIAMNFSQPTAALSYKARRKFRLLNWKDQLQDSGLDFHFELPVSTPYVEHISFSDNSKLIGLGQSFVYLKNGSPIWQINVGYFIGKAYSTTNGNIFIPSRGGSTYGLVKYNSIQDVKSGTFSILLPDHYVTKIIEDRDGGYWASTHHAGIFYCKNPNVEILNRASGLPSEDIVCLSEGPQNYLYLGTRPANIIELHIESNSLKLIPAPTQISREVNIIFYDTIKKKIYANELLHSYSEKEWKPVVPDNSKTRGGGLSAKSISVSPNGKNIWISSFSGFAKIHLPSEKSELLGRNTAKSETERTFSIAQDKDSLIWVTTPKGLRLWRNNQYEWPAFSHPLLHHQARNILITEDQRMILSLSGNGILIKSADGIWQHINTADGLISNNISKFFLSKKGSVYACSSAGLSILNMNNGKWEIVNITEKDGLPSSQVNDVTELEGVLWIATNKGLVKLKNLPAVKAIAAPVLEKLWINNNEVLLQNDLEFDYNENNIAIRFYALHYRSDGKISYRFKLYGADSAFTNANIREVNFANLAAGKYEFQVQAQNEAGQWSNPTIWPFIIHPAWWQTVWFWLIVACFFVAVLGIWYKDRLKKKQHEFEMKIQIKDLEAAALRAQMNPHFIFNSLNSIQHFIAESDKDAAISYLAKFARLVRLALHGSIDGQHTLKEEIEMLENYLALEKLRFRGKFDYSININNNLDPDEIALPPMLVQPFVENALLHGMKNKIEGGKIEISFAINGNALLATIKDNGPGIQSAYVKFENEGHKSVGMTLTKHRLEILSDTGTPNSFQIQNITSERGEIVGTSVTLTIPLGGY